MKKKLLLVSYCFPPFSVAESLLVTRTVRALAKLNWDITVLTVDERSSVDRIDESLLSSLPSSLKIVRAASAERLFLIASHRLIRLAMWKASSVALSFGGLPEIQCLWYPFALQKGKKLLSDQQFDVIHSWASCHTSNFVGLSLHRATGLPWVAHFSDPWIDNPYINFSKLQRYTSKKIEESIMREANALVFTTTQTLELVMRKYPVAWKDKAYVIPHGYERELLGSLKIENKPRKRLHLMYTGSFYKGMRTPIALLQALKKITHDSPNVQDKIELTLIGPNVKEYQSTVKDLRLQKIVNLYGPRSYEACLQALAGADVPVVIDAPSSASSVFLPSKLVDYLIFKKPILGITPPNGASADLLHRLGCPVAAPDDVPAIAKALFELLQLWHSGQLRVSPAYERIALEYDVDQTTQTLSELLQRCIAV